MNEFGLQFLQPGLRLLMFGQVAHKSGEVRHAAGLHFTDREVHRESCSVPALARYDSSDPDNVPFARGAVARQISVVTGPIRHGHQLVDVLADGLLFGIAEQPFGGGAKKLHDAVTVDDDHSVRYRVEDRTEVALSCSQGVLKLLLLIDIQNNSADMTRRPGVVPDESAAGTNPVARVRSSAN